MKCLAVWFKNSSASLSLNLLPVVLLNLPATISDSPDLWQVTDNFVSELFFWCKAIQTVTCLTYAFHLR